MSKSSRSSKRVTSVVRVPSVAIPIAEWVFKLLFAGICALALKEVNGMQESIGRLEQSHSNLMVKLGDVLTQMAVQNTSIQIHDKQLDKHDDRITTLEHEQILRQKRR